MLYAINNIPKPNFLVYLALRSELSSTSPICHNSIDTLNIFNTSMLRMKRHNRQNINVDSNYNYKGKARHYPPASNE